MKESFKFLLSPKKIITIEQSEQSSYKRSYMGRLDIQTARESLKKN